MRLMARPSRTAARLLALLAGLFVCLAAPSVQAQATRYDQAFQTGPTGASRGSGDGAPVFVGLVVGLMVAALVAAGGRAGSARRPPGPQARAWMNVDVSVLRLAIDGRSRAFLERELAKVGRLADATSRPKRARALHRIVRILRKCDAGWVYGASSNHRPMSPPDAAEVFRRHAERARSSEALSRAQGVAASVQDAAGPGGLALLTLVVAARREILDFRGDRRAEIHAVLDDLERLAPSQIVAADLAWLPPGEHDRLSAAALLAVDDTLRALEPIAGREGRAAMRVHCAACGGPFADALPTCPHCGVGAPSFAA